MAWMSLIAAGLFEMFGVLMINRFVARKDVSSAILVGITFSGSLFLLSVALRTLPIGMAYAIWTGIGASGGALLGILFYNESRDWRRVFFIGLILASVVGLKLVG